MKRRIHAKYRQGVGKLRRFLITKFRRNYVKRQETLREGNCIRCGACCKLLYHCPFLEETTDGSFSCKIHQKRPANCRIFPIDHKDLRDRDTHFPDLPCGFRFPAKANEKSGKKSKSRKKSTPANQD